MLKFLGRGSGFSDDYNTAFFMKGNTLVLVDCSIMAFLKLKNGILNQDRSELHTETISSVQSGTSVPAGTSAQSGTSAPVFDEIVVLVTHTHTDHVSGIPMLIQYSYFVWKKHVTIIAPCDEVKDNLVYYFTNLEGINRDAYDMMISDKSGISWIRHTIPTMHVKELQGKCFGYNLEIDGTNIVYTGDTCRIEDFLDYLDDGSIFYTECSYHDSGVHTLIDKILSYDEFFAEKNIRVYLMHLDDESKIMTKLMTPHKTKYILAPLYNG